MSVGFFYCSMLSRGAGEQVFGTASPGDVWLLLEYSRPWGSKAFQESDLSRPIKSALTSALKAVPRSRLLFIKQDRETKGSIALLVVRTQEKAPSIRRLELQSYQDLVELNVPSLLLGHFPEDSKPIAGPLFLVCTHGKRDKCCAKFGFSLYKSLREIAGDSVWQSSHVGGDRFAANLLCFPHGLFHAHVGEAEGRRIVEEYSRGKLTLEHYRGRACYPSPIQAGEYFVRSQSNLLDVDDLRYLDYAPLAERSWRVRFVSKRDHRIHEAHLTSSLSEFQNPMTCASSESKRVVQYSLSEYRSVDFAELDQQAVT